LTDDSLDAFLKEVAGGKRCGGEDDCKVYLQRSERSKLGEILSQGRGWKLGRRGASRWKESTSN